MRLNNLYSLAAASALLLAMIPAQSQENGRARHSRMNAVPAPRTVQIDGSLKDWDRSGELETFVMAATRAQQYGRLAVMYDKSALYIGGEVGKQQKVANRHSPEASGDRAWDADSLQFRIAVDPQLGYPVKFTTADMGTPKTLVHLLLWNYTDRNEANLQVGTGMDYGTLPGSEKFGVVPKNQFQGAYQTRPDQLGYTFEYRIPWAVLGATKAPQAGDAVAATYQFNFGRADGLAAVRESGWAYDLQGVPGFPYQNTGSWGRLNFSPTGNLPHESENTPPAPPQPLSFSYQLPADGEVSIALYDKRNEVVRVLAASAPRLKGRVTEKWDGLDEMGRPLPAGEYSWKGLYHQPITTKYLMSLHNSGSPPYKNDENTGGWGGDHGNPSAVCAVGDDLLLAWDGNEIGSGLIRTSSKGQKKWGIINSQGYLASDGQRVFALTNEFGVGLRVYAAADGGTLAYGNGESVLAAPPGGDEASNKVTGLAYSQGKLYVSYRARNLVAVFDAKQGELLVSWSVPLPGDLAARPDGTLAAISGKSLVTLESGKVTFATEQHLDNPTGIAVAEDGTIFVANQGKLHNVSVFTATGAYVKSIGAAGGRPRLGRYLAAGMLQPRGLAVDKSGRLWVAENADSPKRVSVWSVATGKLAQEFFGAAHYSSQLWMDPARSDEVYCDGVIWKTDWKRNTAYPYSTCWLGSVGGPRGFSSHTSGFYPFTAKNGRQYGLDPGSATLFIRSGDVYKPLLGAVGPSKIWVDKNGDEKYEENEFVEQTKPGANQFSLVDRSLNLWAKGAVYRLVSINAAGHPVYDFSRPETFADFKPVAMDEGDETLYAFDNGYDKLGAPATFDYGRFAKDGTAVWGYRGRVSWPNGLNLPPQRPGKIWGPTQLLGTAGEFTGFATYYGSHQIYTRREGLPVAMLYRDPRSALGKLGPDIIAAENYNGQLVRIPGSKKWLSMGGDQDGRISQVLGLESVKYLSGGMYQLTEADTATAASASATYLAKLAKAKKPIIVKGLEQISAAPGVQRKLSPEQYFSAQVAYDETNLYVRYDVTTPVRLLNSIPDPQLIFKGGNLLDIQIGAEPSADAARKTPVDGDTRVLVTRRDGKPMAVVFRPKVKGFGGKPIVLTSPTGQESFDAIETRADVALNYQERADGFTALVTIPLAVLNWKPRPGTPLRLDLGYIYGNQTGNKALGRTYWSNSGFAAGVLNDIPNESRLVPSEWGEATVE